MPHCQDAPPILGPLPKSTVGSMSASSPTWVVTSSAAQLPEYHKATRPWRKPLSSAGLGLAYPFLNRSWTHVPHFSASPPLRTPSPLRLLLRSIRSPPKLFSIGE